jgi:hypothetical protein
MANQVGYGAKQPNVTEVFTIDSIAGGFSETQYSDSTKATYYNAVGIDPDFAIANYNKTSGAIIPVSYQKFSGAGLTGKALWMITNPKDQNTYVYCSNGKILRYDLNLANETLIGTPTSGAGNGAAYYNNYLYFATPTDVSRYGPLNGAPTLVNTFWTSTLSKTALTNTTYPQIAGTTIPNHPMHVHYDNFLYFGDFINGQGYIHKIRTLKGTAEGDTDNGSAYGAMLLPFGFMPTDIESYDQDVIITAVQTTSSSVMQGRAAVFLWTPTQTTFYRGPVYLPDPMATAMLSDNGVTYIFSGNAVSGGGLRVTSYNGGLIFTQEIYQEEGCPPLAGAVAPLGNRICWGGFTVNPEVSASVFAYGYKKQTTSTTGALHNIIMTTSVGSSPNVTALANAQQSSNNTNRFIVAWADNSATGIDQLSSSVYAYNSYWLSDIFQIGVAFFIKQIRIPLAASVTAGMSCTPVIYLDDNSSQISLTAINSTNFPNGQKKILYKLPDSNLAKCQGTNNFQIAFDWNGGMVATPIVFPIEIIIEKYLDETQ